MAMSALIKSLEDIMRRDAGLNGDAQYIEQILKAFNVKEIVSMFLFGTTLPTTIPISKSTHYGYKS